MKIDLLFVQFALIFLPGLIWAGLDSRYALKSNLSKFQYIVRAFLFGLASYAVTFCIYAALGWSFSVSDISDAATKGMFSAAILKEIALATLVGVLLAILWLYALNYKWDTRFLQWIRATKTYGDEDVWDFTFNSPIAAVEYVHFRDFEKKMYMLAGSRNFRKQTNCGNWFCGMRRFTVSTAVCCLKRHWSILLGTLRISMWSFHIAKRVKS
jgi:hypothetical protein